MLSTLYHIVFTIFTIYVLIESIYYFIFEYKNQKNKFGGICIITFSIFCVLFSNIIVWIN